MRIQNPRLRLALFSVALALVGVPLVDAFFPASRALFDDRGASVASRRREVEQPLSPERHFAAGARPDTAVPCDAVRPFVSTASTTPYSVVDLTCRAQDEGSARRLAESFEVYFAAPFYLYLRPPWAPGPALTEDELRARATFWLARFGENAWPPLPGNVILRREEHTLDPDTDRATSDLPDTAAPPAEIYALGAALGRRMGQLELVGAGDRPYPKTPPNHSATGRSGIDGTQVALGWLVFEHLETGLPALAEHLCRAGCSDLKIATKEVP